MPNLFLNWIPLGYIFETELITTLVYKVSHLTFNVMFSVPWLRISASFGFWVPPYSCVGFLQPPLRLSTVFTTDTDRQVTVTVSKVVLPLKSAGSHQHVTTPPLGLSAILIIPNVSFSYALYRLPTQPAESYWHWSLPHWLSLEREI